MTEADWLGGLDAERMLRFLADQPERDDRKFRLFACACVRRLEAMLTDRRCRAALETSEEFAEKRAVRRQLETVHRAVQQVARAAYSLWMGDPDREFLLHVTQAVVGATQSHALAAAFEASRSAAQALRGERRWQSDLLREVFGNPFSRTHIDPSWIHWNGRTPARLAQAIHEERAFEQMPILADALEEAGCTDEGLIRHCRLPGHVRGCWAIDAILAAVRE